MNQSFLKKNCCLFLSLLLILFAPIPAEAQSEKLDAALNPVSVLGEFSDREEQMIFNQLQSHLSSSYKLVSQEDFDKAQQKFFEEAELEECTEVKCIRSIQEYLQVERLFALSLIRDGNLTQLSLTLVRSEDRLAKSDVCENCNLSTLVNKMKTLVTELVREDLGDRISEGVEFADTTGTASNLQAGFQQITPEFKENTNSKIAFLALESDPPGATVFLGKIQAGTTPYTQANLKPGRKLQITLRKDDYYIKRLETTLRGGVNRIANVKLDPKFGSLVITSQPAGAEVWLAGKKEGVTPYRNNHVLSGTYLLNVNYNLHKSVANEQIVIADGKETIKKYTLAKNFGTLSVNAQPAGVGIVIKDSKKKVLKSLKSPTDIRLLPGKYRVELAKSGYRPLQYTVSLIVGKTVALKGKQATLKQKTGMILVSCDPYKAGSAVMVNGIKKGAVPAEVELPVGTYNIRVNAGKLAGQKQVKIADGKTETLVVKLTASANLSGKSGSTAIDSLEGVNLNTMVNDLIDDWE